MNIETVTVTVEVPKCLIELLTRESYFGLSKNKFFAEAIRRNIVTSAR